MKGGGACTIDSVWWQPMCDVGRLLLVLGIMRASGGDGGCGA